MQIPSWRIIKSAVGGEPGCQAPHFSYIPREYIQPRIDFHRIMHLKRDEGTYSQAKRHIPALFQAISLTHTHPVLGLRDDPGHEYLISPTVLIIPARLSSGLTLLNVEPRIKICPR
jgi:hypothetical protein